MFLCISQLLLFRTDANLAATEPMNSFDSLNSLIHLDPSEPSKTHTKCFYQTFLPATTDSELVMFMSFSRQTCSCFLTFSVPLWQLLHARSSIKDIFETFLLLRLYTLNVWYYILKFCQNDNRQTTDFTAVYYSLNEVFWINVHNLEHHHLSVKHTVCFIISFSAASIILVSKFRRSGWWLMYHVSINIWIL